MAAATSQLTGRTSTFAFCVCVCRYLRTVFEQITFAGPEVFSKGFNLSFLPFAVAAVLGPKVLGTLRVQSSLCRCRMWPQSPASSDCPTGQAGLPEDTVFSVGASSARGNTSRAIHRAQGCSRDPGQALARLLPTATRPAQGYPRPAGALSPSLHPARNFWSGGAACQEKPCPHVP